MSSYTNLTDKQARFLNKYQSNLSEVGLATLIDEAISGGGSASTALLNNAWFVDLRATTNGNGSIGSPFNTIAGANVVSQQFDKIYISGTVTAAGLPGITAFPICEGRQYEFLTPAFLACRPTIIPDATLLGNSFTSIKADYFLVDGDSLTGVDPLIEINCATYLVFEASLLAAGTSVLPCASFFGSTVDGVGGGVIIQNSKMFFDESLPAYFFYNRFDNIDFSANNSRIEVGDANIIDNRADSDVSFSNCAINNDSDTKPTIKIDGGTSFNIKKSRVSNGGTAYALSILDTNDECQMDNNCKFRSDGIVSIFRSVAANLYVCACSEQRIDLNGDNTNVEFSRPSVITTSLAVPNAALYAPLSGQICSGGSPSHLYMYTGAAWVQIN